MAKSKKRKKPAVAPAVPRGTLPWDIDPKRIEASLEELRDKLSVWAKKGRYTKVRFKFRGKQLLPDIPLAAVVAVEGLTFYWTGLLRALVFNLAGQTVVEVELVNDSAKKIQEGKAALLSGDLSASLAAFQEAASMDPDNAYAHLQVGIALKLSGQGKAAVAALAKAVALDPKGPVGAEATAVLTQIKAKKTKAPA